MKDNVNNQIESLINKAMKNTSLEAPSVSFTNTVMAQVNTMQQNSATTYKPLISKPMWVLIFAIGLAIVLYVIYGNYSNQSRWLSYLDFNVLTHSIFANTLSEITIPKTVVYSVILFIVMLYIQIPIIKYYFNKRFEG